MIRLLLLLLLWLAPTVANAGTRATFTQQEGPPLHILIADNGDFDAELWTGHHLIVTGGRAFIVEQRLTGPIVMPLGTLTAIAAERRAAARRSPAGPFPQLIERDGVEVNGRTGHGYFIPARSDWPEQVFAVISNDPALAPIGAAMRRALEVDDIVDWALHETPFPDSGDTERSGILGQGTLIQYYQTRLRDVAQISLPAIPLPAEPETAAQLRTRLAAETAERALPLAHDWMISRAVFAGGRLYVLADDHRLASLAEEDRSLTRHDLDGPVLDICVQGGEPLALTGTDEGAQIWTLRRLHGGHWRVERTVTRANDGPVSLACGPDGIFLLTSRRLLDLSRPRITSLRLRGDPFFARVTSVVHVTPQAVFIGLNSGEWGGGLRRIDRRSGRIETIAHSATSDRCDGPLSTVCDPVQGLATPPWRPDCVVAAIGLIHMLEHGRLTLVCPDRIEQFYVAMDSEAEGQPGTEGAAEGDYGSIAFFGLAASGNGLIAIGHNGLHRIGPNGSATVIPLPRFTRVGNVLVSFALPDVVLVITGINGRASVSGAVPIMAVR